MILVAIALLFLSSIGWSVGIDPSKISPEIAAKYTVDKNTFFGTPKNNARDKIQIEIGDSKKSDFLPQVKISRWDDEINLSYRLVDDSPEPSVTTSGNKIIWSGDAIEVQFYDIQNQNYPEGAIEVEVILKQKPHSNVVIFAINTKGLEFYYQPPLTQGNIDEGCSRPTNVVGSYAVYAVGTKVNYIGGKEYKTGKVGHIFRPKIIDADKKETWGDLHVDAGNELLTITIPQKFLDEAAYPVSVDPTFGYSGSAASNVELTNTTNKVATMVGAYTASAGDTITKYSIKAREYVGNGLMYITPYTAVAGVPLVPYDGTGTLVDLGIGEAYYDSAAVSHVLSAGITYCLAIRFNSISNNLIIYYDDGSAPGRLSSDSTTFTNPFSVSGTDSGRHYGIYATYTAGGASVISKVSGVAQASISKVSGVASASISKVAGVGP